MAGTQIIIVRPPQLATLRFAEGRRQPRENFSILSLRAKRSNLTAGTQIIIVRPPRLATLRFAEGMRRPRENFSSLALRAKHPFGEAIPRPALKSFSKVLHGWRPYASLRACAGLAKTSPACLCERSEAISRPALKSFSRSRHGWRPCASLRASAGLAKKKPHSVFASEAKQSHGWNSNR